MRKLRLVKHNPESVRRITLAVIDRTMEALFKRREMIEKGEIPEDYGYADIAMKMLHASEPDNFVDAAYGRPGNLKYCQNIPSSPDAPFKKKNSRKRK